MLALFVERSTQYQQLEPSGCRNVDPRPGRPFFKAHLLDRILEQRQDGHRRPILCWREGPSSRYHANFSPVCRIELPELDENRAAGRRTRRMARRRRIADVAAGRIVAMFVLKHPIQDEKFLAAVMDMR